MFRCKLSNATITALLLAFAVPYVGTGEDKSDVPSKRIDGNGRPQAKAVPAKGVEGNWLYFLEISALGGEYGFLSLSREPNGGFTATFADPQHRQTTRFSIVTVKDGKVEVKQFGLLPIFKATLAPDESCLEGKLLIGEHWKPAKLVRVVGQLPKIPRPQEPKKPYPYDEEEVVFAGKDDVRLAGTLTLPRGPEVPHPAVLLIAGSQPVDRNYLTAGHLPFLVLADYLTRRGLAVLRVDSRGVGKSAGAFGLATTQERAEDVLAALAFLKQRKDIDSKRIGLIGHSEGAAVAALAASRDQEIAWVVLLAGQAVPSDQLALRQTEMCWNALKPLGIKDTLITFSVDYQKQVIDVLKRAPNADAAEKALKELDAAIQAKLTGEDRKRMGVNADFRARVVGSPRWLYSFIRYDPRASLSKIRCPVLALNGDKDLVVSSKENLSAIEKALKAGGNRDGTFKELPGLNHMFQTCVSGSPLEYGVIDETIAPAVLELIGRWIAERR